jgi:hydrogenase maturation protease
MTKILVYGYGNPGRQDDGLGAALVEQLDAWLAIHPELNVTTDCNYQLNIEDVAAIAGSDLVIFVDATLDEEVVNFRFETVKPSDARVEFTMHAVSPSFVLDLCGKILGTRPQAYLLQIRGYTWDFEERISDMAQQNLQAALDYLKHYLANTATQKVLN